MNDTKATIRIYFNNADFKINNFLKWLKRADFFKPVYCETDRGNQYKEILFTENNFEKIIFNEEKKSKKNFSITLHNERKDTISFYKQKDTSFIVIYIKDIHENSIIDWLHFTDSIFQKDRIGITACFYPENDYFWQQNVDPEQYKLHNRSLEGIKVIQISKHFCSIDRTNMPGHSRYFKEIWFGSTWMMWYGKDYFKYIPKDRFISFPKAFEIKEFDGEAIRIQLFENWKDYENSDSRQIQQEFRDFLGIKDVVEALEEASAKGESEPDASVELFAQSQDEFGNPIRIHRFYVDQDGKNVPKSQAFEEIAYPLDENGHALGMKRNRLN